MEKQKDREVIEYLCTLDPSELNYYKGVVEALIINQMEDKE